MIPKWRPVQVCCKGYARSSNGTSCIPICSQHCYHGKCVEPDVCKCQPGYGGGACSKCKSIFYFFLGYVQLAVSSLFSCNWANCITQKLCCSRSLSLFFLFKQLPLRNHLRSEKHKFFISHCAAFETETFSVLFSFLTYLLNIPILKTNFVYLLLSTSFTSPEV